VVRKRVPLLLLGGALHRAWEQPAARSAPGIGLDKKLVLCLGTTEPRKSQAPLARAFARIARQFPEALLALVGRGDDPYTSLYADCVEEHLLRSRMLDRVLIRPLTSNPFEWHVAADVLVCASDMESLPRVILEAMAFETLAVSTDIFLIPEVIEDGVTGFSAGAATSARSWRSSAML
jgi:glycosyltransferase involved in cell wall biosynthesis